MSIYNFYSIYLPTKIEKIVNWYVNSLHKKLLRMNTYFHFTEMKSTNNLYHLKNYNNYSQNQTIIRLHKFCKIWIWNNENAKI